MWGLTYKVMIVCPNRATKIRIPLPCLDTKMAPCFSIRIFISRKKNQMWGLFRQFRKVDSRATCCHIQKQKTWPSGRHKKFLREMELCSAPGAVSDDGECLNVTVSVTLPLNLAAWMDGIQLQLSVPLSRARSLSHPLSLARALSHPLSLARAFSRSLSLFAQNAAVHRRPGDLRYLRIT